MPESKSPKNKKKQRNRFLALTSLPFQMGGTIYLGAYFGKKNWIKILLQQNRGLPFLRFFFPLLFPFTPL